MNTRTTTLLLVLLLLSAPATTLADGDRSVSFTVEGTIGFLETHGQQFVPAQDVSIMVYEHDSCLFGTLYGIGESNPDGSFSIQCTASIDYPFRVLCRAINPAVSVINANSQQGGSYHYRTERYALPADGATVDVGTLLPDSPDLNRALEIAETIYRGRQMYQSDLGVSVPSVDVLFPDPFGAATEPYYFELLDQIVVPGYQDLREDQLLRSYAIQFQSLHGMHWHVLPDYCNGNCDPDVGQSHCGSCLWCEEDVEVAWREGWALFLSRLGTEYIEAHYPTTGLQHEPIDDILVGQETFCALGGAPTPGLIPGYFAAVMWDLADGDDYGESNDVNPGYQDVAQDLAADLIAGAVTVCGSLGRLPQTPEEMLRCLMEGRPDLSTEIWETCALNSFHLDDTAPGAPTITAHSPPVGIATPSSTIWLSWDPPEDGMSGVAGYSHAITTSGPAMPGNSSTTIEAVDNHLFANISPGTYYISLRAVDEAGNWSDDWAWKGPFILTSPEPVDLEPHTLTGWEYPLVPRGTPDASFGNAQVADFLPGYEASTYLSYGARNTGTVNAGPSVTALYVDADTVSTDNLGTLGGGMVSSELNLGPVTVRGGRHVLGVHLDSDHDLNEPNENDNYWAGQWAWRPDQLSGEVIYTRSSPPGLIAGFEFFSFEMPFSGNCAGHQIEDFAFFQGVFLYSADQVADYDLKLFDDAAGVESGFYTPLAHSGRPGGCLEGVLVFGINAGIADDWNVGVVNMDHDQGAWADSDYRVCRTQGINLPGYATVPSNLNSAGMLDVYTVYIEPDSDGCVTFTLDPESPLPMYLGFYDHDFATGSLLDATVLATATDGHPVSVSVQAPVGSYCGLAVWRDPVGSLAVSHPYTLTYAPARPDPATHEPEGWLSCAVPHGDNYQDVNNLTMPTWLPGNGAPTTIYYAEINHGLVACPQHDVQIRLDGEEYDGIGHDNRMDPGEEHRGNIDEGYVMPGGRHTLTMRLDPEGDLEPENTANNTDGYQWVWEPTLLGIGGTATFSAPRFMMSGWDEVASGTYLYFNQLGFTNDDALSPAWGQFAVISLAMDSADLDLLLYHPSTGATDGFDLRLAGSIQGGTSTDFIVIDLETTGTINRDFGVRNWSHLAGIGAITLDITGSAMPHAVGEHGPYPLPANAVHTAWEFNLPPGRWPITLSSDATPVDLGFAVIPAGDAHTPRSGAPQSAIAWAEPAGNDEEILVQVEEAGQAQCLIIWREGSEHLAEAVQYTITIGGDLTGVADDGAVPAATRLLAPAPNPFNPRTTVAFELAAPGAVKLGVYDLAGRLVRTLVSGEHLPAGRHERTWQGRDDHGQQVATGLYFCRLETAAAVHVQRMMLVK